MPLNWTNILIGGAFTITVLLICILTFPGFLIKMNKNAANINNSVLAKPKLSVDTVKKKSETTAFPFTTSNNNNNKNNSTNADSAKLLPSYETEEEEFMSEDEGVDSNSNGVTLPSSASHKTTAAAEGDSDIAAGDNEDDGDEDGEVDHGNRGKPLAKNVATIKFDKTNIVEAGDFAEEAGHLSPESEGVKNNETLSNARNGKRKLQKEAEEIEHDAKSCVGCSNPQNKRRKKKAASAAQTGGESKQDASNQGVNHRSPSPQSKCGNCVTLQKCLRNMMKTMDSLISCSN